MKFNCMQCHFEHEISEFVAETFDIVCDCGVIMRALPTFLLGEAFTQLSLMGCNHCKALCFFRDGKVYCSACKRISR